MLKRKEFHIGPITEQERVHELAVKLHDAGYNADNAVIITVSSEYSAYVGQYVRHYLSSSGEVTPGFAIDVPYPDETWDYNYQYQLDVTLKLFESFLEDKDRTAILVEAGVIRGGNYTYVVNDLKNKYPDINLTVNTVGTDNIYMNFSTLAQLQFHYVNALNEVLLNVPTASKNLSIALLRK